MDVVISTVIRIFFTVFFLIVGGWSLSQAYGLWVPSTVLGRFEFRKDGVLDDASSTAFQSKVSSEIDWIFKVTEQARESKEVHMDGTEVGTIPIGSLGASPLADIDVEAYGVKWDDLFKALSRWMKSSTEFGGSISPSEVKVEGGTPVTFYAVHSILSHNAITGSAQRRIWFTPMAKNLEEAAREAACFLVLEKANGAFGELKPPQLSNFFAGLDRYERYRSLISQGDPLANQCLIDAEGFVNAGQLGESKSLPALHLSGIVAYKRKNYGQAQKFLRRYLDLLKEKDPKRSDLVAERMLEGVEAFLKSASESTVDAATTVAEQATDGNMNDQTFQDAQKASSPSDLIRSMERYINDNAGAANLKIAIVLQPGMWAGTDKSRSTVCAFAFNEKTRKVVAILPGFAAENSEKLNVWGLRSINPNAHALVSQKFERVRPSPGANVSEEVLLAELEPGWSYDNHVDKLTVLHSFGVPVVDDRVSLYGATSGIRTPLVLSVQERTFRYEKVTAPGDAGAPILDKNGNLVGMHIAGALGDNPYSEGLRLDWLARVRPELKLLPSGKSE